MAKLGSGFKLAATLNITPAELDKMFKEMAAVDYPEFTVAGVKFKTKTEWHGFGGQESSSVVFDGVEINLKPKE